jgi:hypothetical protein
MKTAAQAEFIELLSTLKMSDGEISYRKTFKHQDASATLWLSPPAYSKTVALINAFSDEVAWHGAVTRIADNEFVIEDIFVYPQEVTGSTVNTDQEGYTKWLYEFDDEAFSKIRMQGHSHVNMGVNPSGVDSGHREKILDQLDNDMFYVFMIWNKSLATHALIYDMENNILYDDKDVTVKLAGDGSLDEFLADAEKKVQKKKAAVQKAKIKKDKDDLQSILPASWGRTYDYRYGRHDYFDL